MHFDAKEPIISGFYPDPTIAAGPEGFLLANSSFEYFPAAPVFWSRDLATWTPIGNIIDRPSQFALGNLGSGGGIYGSTLRYHGGRYWFVTTNVNAFTDGQLLFTAVDPAGAWSEPTRIPQAFGFDPDLSWDDNGKARLTWCRPTADFSAISIVSCEVDLDSGALIGDAIEVWQGTGLQHPEGAHLYRRNGWWYLLIAEGGTGAGHAISIARSRGLAGPWESAPNNPILTHRSTDNPVQSVGHGDLVEGADGRWFLVYLGTRPRGQHPQWHVLGRETFAARVDWSGEWPVILEEVDGGAVDHSFVEVFDDELDSKWITPNGYRPASIKDGALVLDSAGSPDDPSWSRGVFVRVRDSAWNAECTLTDSGALILRLDDHHWIGLRVTNTEVTAVAQIGSVRSVLGAVDYKPGARLQVSAVDPAGPRTLGGGPDTIRLTVLTHEGSVHLGSIDGRYFSTEVAGGFTGRVVGIVPWGGRTAVGEFAYTTK